MNNEQPQLANPSNEEQLLAEISAGIPQPPTPKNHRRGRVIGIILGVLVLILVGVGIVLYATPKESCLSTSDFTQLAGTSYVGNFDSTQSFYDYMFDFIPDGATYDPSSGDDYSADVGAMATFYRTHSDKHVHFTIKTYDRTPHNASLSDLRQQRIRDQLIESGIPSGSISVSSSDAISGLSNGEHSEETVDSVMVSITSDDTCRR